MKGFSKVLLGALVTVGGIVSAYGPNDNSVPTTASKLGLFNSARGRAAQNITVDVADRGIQENMFGVYSKIADTNMLNGLSNFGKVAEDAVQDKVQEAIYSVQVSKSIKEWGAAERDVHIAREAATSPVGGASWLPSKIDAYAGSVTANSAPVSKVYPVATSEEAYTDMVNNFDSSVLHPSVLSNSGTTPKTWTDLLRVKVLSARGWITDNTASARQSLTTNSKAARNFGENQVKSLQAYIKSNSNAKNTALVVGTVAWTLVAGYGFYRGCKWAYNKAKSKKK